MTCLHHLPRPHPSPQGSKFLAMATHRYHSSLEGVLDFSIPLSLTTQQHESARNLVIRFVRHYGSEKTIRKGYRPAALIQATLDHVKSPDTFMTFFLSYIYKVLRSDEGHAVDSDITHALVFFEGFSSWEPEQISKLHEGLESFAEYLVENFLLPRSLIPYIYVCLISSEYILIRNCSQSIISQDTTTNAHVVIIAAELNTDRTEMSYTRPPPLCSVSEIR